MFSQFFEKYQKWSLIVSALMFLLAIFLIFRPLESLSTFIMLFAIIILGYQYLYLHFGLLKALSAVFKFLYLPVAILFFKHFYFPVTKSKVLLIARIIKSFFTQKNVALLARYKHYIKK